MRILTIATAVCIAVAGTFIAAPTAQAWENLGGVLTSNTSCTTWSANRIDCFARGTDNAMWHRWWNGSAWGGWETLGGVITTDPNCVSWGPNRIDCFARGTDNALWHRWWNGSAWGGWESLGGVITGPPECVSWGANRIDCFAKGTDNAMWHRWWNGSAWCGWESLGGVITSNLSCTSWSANRIDCFARGTDNAMYHRWWSGSAWGGWESLGGVINMAPECVSWSANRIDCFARGGGNAMYHRWWNGSAWGGWESLGGVITSEISCTTWSANRIDCFARGTDNAMWHRWWNGSAWGGWESLGGVITTRPECVSWSANRIDCFARGTDNGLYHRWWNGSSWGPGPSNTVHNLQVRRFTTTTLTNADADRILADASTVLQVSDGADDVATAVEFRRSGGVTTFATGTGVVTSQASFNAILAQPGDVFVLNAISWCGSPLPGIIGCAPVPGGALVVVRFTPSLEGILWAHEFGHNMGLPHLNNANFVMNPFIAGTARRVNAAQSTAYRGPTPAVGGAVAGAEASTAGNVDAFVLRLYVEGVPFESARALGPAALPRLRQLLSDPGNRVYASNIVGVMGIIGEDGTAETLINFVEGNRNRALDPDTYRASLTAVMSLGYLANRGDASAMSFLSNSARALATASPATTPDLRLEPVAVGQNAVLGLGLSGRPEGAQVLQELRNARIEARIPGAAELLTNSQTTLDRVRQQGVGSLYRNR